MAVVNGGGWYCGMLEFGWWIDSTSGKLGFGEWWSLSIGARNVEMIVSGCIVGAIAEADSSYQIPLEWKEAVLKVLPAPLKAIYEDFCKEYHTK